MHEREAIAILIDLTLSEYGIPSPPPTTDMRLVNEVLAKLAIERRLRPYFHPFDIAQIVFRNSGIVYW